VVDVIIKLEEKKTEKKKKKQQTDLLEEVEFTFGLLG